MFNLLRPASTTFLLLTVLTGIVYPLLVTAVAQTVFAAQANGSLIVVADGKIVGSELIGQTFDNPRYFWSRPSAVNYNAGASSGSNLGPTNPALVDAVKSRVNALHAADPEQDQPVPVDLVTTSGSGLDPHISPAAAAFQVPRVAKARGVERSLIDRLLNKYTQERTLGILGERRVNVLLLNRALDRELAPREPTTDR